MMPGITWSLLVAISLVVSACGDRSGDQAPHVIAANELAAMSRLRSIAQAERHFHALSGGKYASMDELIEQGHIRDPSHGKLTGYKIEVRVHANGFEATAEPANYPVSGRRSFYIDETGLLRGADHGGEKAGSADPEA